MSREPQYDAAIKVLGILTLIVLLILGFITHRQKIDCDARHGVLVRGALSMACVAQPPSVEPRG